jgi:hypothetical protein
MPRLTQAAALTAVLACVATFGVVPAANAADAAPASGPTRAVQEVAVSGVSWSAPAFPVDCQVANQQISCTPTTPSDVRPLQCFINVPFGGGTAMLCTTFEGQHEAIRAAGGRAVLVSYGCTIGDLVCGSFENFGRGMALSATAAAFVMGITISFDTDSTLWSAAVGEWSFWQWAVLIILFASMVWSIATAVVARDHEQLVGAIVRSFIAIPAVPLTLWTIGHLVNALDEMTWYILNQDGPGSLFVTLQKAMWAGGRANYFFAFLIHGLLLVAMLLLVFVFVFRNLSLAVLIAVGPVAWMLFPIRTIGPQWIIRYLSAVAALLLTGPLTIGFLALVINGLGGVQTIWDPRSWPLIAGLVLITFAPFAVFGLFSFIGGTAVDSIGSRIGGSATRSAGTAARGLTRLPSRIGATPAGRPPSPSGGTGTGGGGVRPPQATRVGAAPAAQSLSQAQSNSTSSTPSPTPAVATPRRNS